MKFPLFFLYRHRGCAFRKMRCSRIKDHFALPFLDKGQGLITSTPHKACSKRQKGKVAPSEITDLRVGTTLKKLLVLHWPCSRLAGLFSESRQLRHKESVTLSDTTCDCRCCTPLRIALTVKGSAEGCTGPRFIHLSVFPTALLLTPETAPKSDDVSFESENKLTPRTAVSLLLHLVHGTNKAG